MTKTNGANTTVTRARQELLLTGELNLSTTYQPKPRRSFNDGPTNGRKVATTLRKKVAAARAEAE